MRALFFIAVVSGMLLKTADVTAHSFSSCRKLGSFSLKKMQCRLVDTDNMRVVCRIAALSSLFPDIKTEFTGLPNRATSEGAYRLMLRICYQISACGQRFSCSREYPLPPTDSDGCHIDPLTGEYHCH